MARELTPREIEQIQAFQSGLKPGFSARKASQEQIDEFIEAARLIGAGRAQGLSDEDTIVALAKSLVAEDSRRASRNPELAALRQKQLDEFLAAEGMEPSDIAELSERELVQADENFGYAFEEDATLASDGKVRTDRNEGQRARLAKARKQRPGARRDAYIKKIEQRIADNAESQKVFDFGLIPIVGEDEDPVSPRERGRFVQRGAEVYTDDKGVRRVKKKGDLSFQQGGGFIEGPNGPIQIPARRVKAERDDGGVAQVPDGATINPDIPVMAPSEEMERLNQQDRAMGQSEVRKFERFERGDLTEAEMQQAARLAAGRIDNSPLVSQTPITFVDDSVPRPDPITGVNVYRQYVKSYVDKDGKVVPASTIPIVEKKPQPGVQNYYRDGSGKGDEFDVRPQKKIVSHPGVGGSVSPDEAQSAILGQLRARKANQSAGRRAQMIANIEDAGLEAVLLGRESNLKGKAAVEGLPNVSVLGQLKGDRLKKDMGLVLGDQRANTSNAVRIEMPDGSFRYVDAAGNDLASPVKEAQSVNMAELLNAPDGANNAFDFVQKNQFEDRGAQFFGDEGILAQLNDKSSGGGIEQVDISGAMRDIEQRVADRLGIPPKRINSVKGFQAAMNAVLADQAARGNAIINIVDGQKVVVENPGVEEALVALKIQPREAKQIANALKQQELAQFDRFDQRAVIDDAAVRPGPNPKNVIAGVNDPARGGDRVDIAKDVKFQGKVQGAGITGEAARPFIGLQASDPRRVGDTQVFQGMNPTEVREFMEGRQRANREKKVAAAAKSAKKKGNRVVDLGPGIQEQRRNVEAIRKMQEGNIFAQVRADRAAAQSANKPVNVMGSMISPTQQPVPGDFAEPRVGYKKVVPGVKRKGDAELLPRPARPATVTDAGEGFRNVQVPEGFKPRSERENRIGNFMARAEDIRTNPKYQRGRRIAYGAGGGAAALATVLGLGNMGKEEEEQQY